MGLTRKLLKGMGISDEQIDTIIEAHAETVDALKEQITGYKADADKLAEVEKELAEANKTIEANGKDSYKVKYDAVKEDFEKYKAEISAKETHGAKLAAYRDVLKACGVSGKRIDSILKVSNIDGIELDEDGKIKDGDALTDSIKSEWADFIVTEQTRGAKTATPPAQVQKKAYTREDIEKMSPDEINKNWDDIQQSLKNL